ncbi:helix-turn-helix domain-containing protein [Alkalicoccus urumqiensis]|uniref:HTH cro/C1-type domain-containing protein n=1 Tax=Alkalicoccus urumqiensis TaxID=1548213 RepID=A0A2P6ME63_ALKUR|nr:helix-turn-helix transcriptional regulator [Alkalicoccus urumqiensis]PRO64572.1 hypothetical protein C6I21_13835 [Alkalicoccus urumqiensis]
MPIGDNIQDLRKEKGLTQAGLAKLMGISRSYLSDVENNRKNPSLKTIESLAEKLGVSVLYLTSGNKAISDFTDEEKVSLFRDVWDKHRSVSTHELSKRFEETKIDELPQHEITYLINSFNFMNNADEKSVILFAALFRNLNDLFPVSEEDPIDSSTISEQVEDIRKNFNDYLDGFKK